MSEVPVRVPDEWFVGFHQGLAARFWRAAAAAMAEDDTQVVRRLVPDPPASVLDVPCGDGRLTTRLAAAGYEVTGVDLIASEVEHARRAAAVAGVEARFAVGDLRALPDVGRVDALVSWGNAFGYLVPAETARSLASMRAALRPGGRLVLESMTVAESFLVGDFKPSAEWEYGGIRLSATNHYRVTESRLESDFTFEDARGPRRALPRGAPRPHQRRGRTHAAACGLRRDRAPGRRRHRGLRARLATPDRGRAVHR